MPATIFDPGECGCPTAGLSCTPCDIPYTNLSLAYVNALVGSSSTAMTWNGLTGLLAAWSTTCLLAGSTRITLLCIAGINTLEVLTYSGGACTGLVEVCDLAPVSSTCSPLSLAFTVNALVCPGAYTNGWRSFTVT